MTKADLVATLAGKGLSKHQAAETVEATLAILKATLQAGETIQIVRFGGFHVRAKRARRGRNPGTGEPITIAARKVVRFRPGEKLRALVNLGTNGEGPEPQSPTLCSSGARTRQL